MVFVGVAGEFRLGRRLRPFYSRYLGPKSHHKSSPAAGNRTTNNTQSTLLPVLAALLIILRIAQMSSAKTTIPSSPPASKFTTFFSCVVLSSAGKSKQELALPALTAIDTAHPTIVDVSQCQQHVGCLTASPLHRQSEHVKDTQARTDDGTSSHLYHR